MLSRDAVVVALGGARGITAELLTGLAERYQCRLYVLGSNPLDSYPADVFAGSDEEFAAGRASYISAEVKAGNGTVAEATRRFSRMVDARTARANLTRMARHSGEDRVSYLTCDAKNESSVRDAIATVLGQEKQIDLIINAPGLNRSGLIRDKDITEFRDIRDLKLAAHRNLHRALAKSPPRVWCDFGSLLGFFGQVGEADYASGNDYLATAAGYATATSEITEFVIGWTLWDEVGMGADELTRAYFKRAGSYTHMPAAEGVEHFVDELESGRFDPSVVHLGEAEWATVERFYPGFRDHGIAPRQPDRGVFYLRTPVQVTEDLGDTEEAGNRENPGSTPSRARYECVLDPHTDSYVQHHQVRGIPTLPGAFVAEIAAEIATRLVPGAAVVAFEDVRFHHFLRVRPHGPALPRRITAQIAQQTEHLSIVEVEVTHDVIAPSGTLLVADKPHFSARALLASDFPAAPHWEGWDDFGELQLPDPYHAEQAPVQLTGPFMTTTGTRRHPQGARAEYRPHLSTGQPWSSFLVPVLLLDAMARTGVLDPVDSTAGRCLPIAAPLSIRRIDLYQQANDLELSATNEHLDLYAVNPGFGSHGLDNRFVAASPDGRVVAQMKGIDATVIGLLQLDTGHLHPPEVAREEAPMAGSGVS